MFSSSAGENRPLKSPCLGADVEESGSFAMARDVLSEPCMRRLVISWLVIWLLFPGAALGLNGTVAVWAIQDGDSDAVSSNAAFDLGVDLSKHGWQVVSDDVVSSVAGYYPLAPESSARKQIEDELTDARNRYYQFEFREAQALLNDVADKSCPMPLLGERGDFCFQALIASALAARAQKDSASVKKYLERAAVVAPHARLDESLYPPGLIHQFEGMRRSVLERPSGDVAVETDPPAIDVYLNGMYQGVTPWLERLPAGSYVVTLHAENYVPIEKNIRVEESQRCSIDEKIRWKDEGDEGVLSNDREEVVYGLGLADLLQVDDVILLNAETSGDGEGVIKVRVLDGNYMASQKPFEIKYSGEVPRGKILQSTEKTLRVDIGSNPQKYLDSRWWGSPALMVKRDRRPVVKSPVFWGVIGAAAAGAIAGGIAASMGGGDGGDGRVRVNLSR